MALLGNAPRNTADEICRRQLAVRVGEGYVDVLAMPKERGLRARCPFASHRNVGEDAASSVYSSNANIVAANEHVLRIVSMSLNIPLYADTLRSIRQCRSAMSPSASTSLGCFTSYALMTSPLPSWSWTWAESH